MIDAAWFGIGVIVSGACLVFGLESGRSFGARAERLRCAKIAEAEAELCWSLKNAPAKAHLCKVIALKIMGVQE
jgi:hypothetical protein